MNAASKPSDDFDIYLDDWNPTEDDLKSVDEICSRFWTGQTPPPPSVTPNPAESSSSSTAHHSSASPNTAQHIDAQAVVALSNPPPADTGTASTRGRKRGSRTQSPQARKGKAKTQTRVAESSTAVSNLKKEYLESDSKSPLLLFRPQLRLTVTDLVTLAWCEVKFDYGLRGRRYLGEQMDNVVVSKHGKQIPVEKEIVKMSEKVMKKGNAVHKKLEMELPSVEITVKVRTAEERCGLELLNTLSNLKMLSLNGPCREVRVFGFIEGIFVTGIIDEITRKPVMPSSPFFKSLHTLRSPPRTPPRKPKASTPTGGAQLTLDHFAFSPLNLNGEPNTPNSPRSPSASPQIRRNPPRTAKTKGKLIASEGPKLAFRVHINDTKTREQRTLPSDDLSGRLQLMIYRRLLSALLTPPSLSYNPTQGSETGPNFSFSFPSLFEYRKLNPNKGFSDQFIQQAQEIMPEGRLLRNLNEVVECWWSIVDGLGLQTPNGAWDASEKDFEGPVDPELELIYRSRGGTRTQQRKGKRGGKGKKDALQPLNEDVKAANTQGLTLLSEEEQLTLAIHMSLEESNELKRESKPADSVDDSATAKDPSPAPLASSSGSCSPDADRIPASVADILDQGTMCSQGISDWDKEDGEYYIRDEELKNIKTSQEYVVTSQEYKTSASQEVEPTSQEYVTALSQEPPKSQEYFTAQESPAPLESSLNMSTNESKDTIQGHKANVAGPTRTLATMNPVKEESDSELSSPSEELDDLGISVIENFGQPDAKVTKQSSFGHHDIIGITRFKYDQQLLNKRLTAALEYWTGVRDPVGVDIEDTWKCGFCEYREGCEWRSAQALSFSKGQEPDQTFETR
ncbi:hypothetical protein FRC03_000143 [Tulasnella sp. 419]|nr:hypothetical protein FRC03_000143 [Tulasnella sp. 419]